MVGASLRISASSMPSRSTTPGRKFCTSTSAVRHSRLTMSTPCGGFRSMANGRLLRLGLRKDAENALRGWPVSGGWRAVGARVVALARLLDFDHVGTLIGEDHGRPGAG